MTNDANGATGLPPFRSNVAIAYVTTAAEAGRLFDEIERDAGDGLVAVDLETVPTRAEADRLCRLNDELAAAKGVLAAQRKTKAAKADIDAQKAAISALVTQAKYAAGAGLDPYRADIRLLQLYAGGDRVAVIDIFRTGPAILQRLSDCRIVTHNAGFDLAFLTKHGVEPAEVHCTQQAVGLTQGPGATRLEHAAANYLGVSLDKDMQTSDWSREHLTEAQVRYAANDAIVCWQVAQRVLCALDRQVSAYEIQMGALPAVMRMKMRGFGVDIEAHTRLIGELRREHDKAADRYAQACLDCGHKSLADAGVPSRPNDKIAVLEVILTSDELDDWRRTDTGKLSTRRSELRRAVHYPPIAELTRLSSIDKMLSAFDAGLSALASPSTGRIHAHYRVAGASSGRATCSGPNLQQVPRDKRFRALFVASPGNVLIVADYSSMELRAAAHISGDQEMTRAFQQGVDLHRLTASWMTGKNQADVTEEERRAAKPVNFGAIYGQGARGLMETAWSNYGIVLTEAEARAQLLSFKETYRVFACWCDSHANRCRDRREIVIGRDAAEGIGRLFPLSRLPDGASSYTRSCNYPIQGGCADTAMLAIAAIDAALYEAGIDGGPVAWLHDEIVLEVPAEHAAKAAELLTKAMTDAFAETFPGAPLRDLVKVHIGADWAAAKP
jgi:DNA polymerase I-like protein with 3'-5' exonuclease and polymerase domains